MHLDSLKYFIYICEEKSISKAAKRVHISQSALSQMIHKLEEDFGYELLNRSNKGVSLTPRGEIVYKYSNNIIKHFDLLMEDLKSFDANHNKIIISGTWSLAAYSLPCMIYRIKKKFPEHYYKLVAKSVDEIVLDVKDGLTDFGFVDYVDDNDPDVIYHKMGQEKVVLVAKEDYKVPDQLRVKDLVNIELIMCTMNKKTCEHLEDALRPMNMTLNNLNVIFNADSLTSVKSSVLNGYGMAFVPYESIKHELYEKSVKLIEVEDLDLDYDIYMLSQPVKLLSKSAKMSRDYLIEVGRKSFC